MTLVRLNSLRTRFLVPLALGGSLVASAGLWITYTTTVDHFEAQLVERGRLLADALNHSTMVVDTSMQVQHVVDEISHSPHIRSIVVATFEPPEIMASSNRAWNGMRLDRLPDRHLSEHLLESMAQGDFGHHFDDAGDALILIAPLGLPLSDHQGRGISMMASGASSGPGTAQGDGTAHEHGGKSDYSPMPEQGIAQGHGGMAGRGPSLESEHGTTGDRPPYHGAIMLFLNSKEASAAVSQILWLLCIALLAAVMITVSIAYVLVDRQILARLNTIRRAMSRHDANAGAARVPVVANDEISGLGRAFNNMADRIDSETRRRENLVKDLKDSEERFKSVVNNSPTKIHIKDVEGRYVLVNRQAEILFGVSNEEAKGKTTAEIFPPDQANPFVTHDRAVLETGQTIEQEEEWLREDGIHTFLTVKFPILDSAGNITAVGAVGTDITERKRIEEALRDSRDHVRLITDNLPAGISYLDGEQRFRFVNRTLEEWYGRPAEEILGRTLRDILGKEVQNRISPNVDATLKGKAQTYEHVVTHPDGNTRALHVEYVPHMDETRKPQGFFTLIHDITERRRADEALLASEQALQERIAELEEAQRNLEMQGESLVDLADALRVARDESRAADRAKSEFLAAMSHELRTPMNAVLGFSEILKNETLGPIGNTKYREYADDIHDSGKHLLGLINDILDLSKIESGTDDLNEDTIDIPKIIHSALKLVEQRAEQGAVKLEIEIADQLPALRADERKLKQILVNLLANAIKFTDAGGEVALWAWCRMDSGHVFQITDIGIGIASEDIPKALSRFGQVDADLNRQYEGTGLGLPLTKALVELHGGSLDLQSQVGVGTTVTVRFPADRIVNSPRDTESLETNAKKAG
jgi:PAS domain S-box-containing protein